MINREAPWAWLFLISASRCSPSIVKIDPNLGVGYSRFEQFVIVDKLRNKLQNVKNMQRPLSTSQNVHCLQICYLSILVLALVCWHHLFQFFFASKWALCKIGILYRRFLYQKFWLVLAFVHGYWADFNDLNWFSVLLVLSVILFQVEVVLWWNLVPLTSQDVLLVLLIVGNVHGTSPCDQMKINQSKTKFACPLDQPPHVYTVGDLSLWLIGLFRVALWLSFKPLIWRWVSLASE